MKKLLKVSATHKEKDLRNKIRCELFGKVKQKQGRKTFELALNWLKGMGWETDDVSPQKRTQIISAVRRETDDNTAITCFKDWLQEAKFGKTGNTLTNVDYKTTMVLTDIDDITSEDEAQYYAIRDIIREERLSKNQKGRFYGIVIGWLEKKGWTIPDSQRTFGILQVGAVERQCQIEDPFDELEMDSHDFFFKWLDLAKEKGKEAEIIEFEPEPTYELEVELPEPSIDEQLEEIKAQIELLTTEMYKLRELVDNASELKKAIGG